MEFAEFAAYASRCEAETADLAITEIVTELLSDANDDLPIVARFIQGVVFPSWQSITLDIGPNLVYEAIARSAAVDVAPADVETRLAELGEIGAVAASYELSGQRDLSSFGTANSGLLVQDVYEDFERIANAEGAGSQERKLEYLSGLLNRSTPEEARFLVRLVLSEMRIGVGEGTVRDAIATAFDVSVERVERALQVSNDIGRVAETARDSGEAGLRQITLQLGRPVQSMLAQTGTITDAVDAWGETAVQWKYDGARIGVHYDESTVHLYSRNLEEVSESLPEIVEFVETHATCPVILDGEVVAVDDEGVPLPFQEILRRFRRKYDIERAREETALEVYFFDCLHADGTDLLDAPLTERYDVLTDVVSDGISDIRYTDDPDEIASVEAESLAAGHEGIMLKNPDSMYSPGRRGKNWLKIKPGVETLDVVVTGAEWGEGRRATFLGTFEVSVRANGSYATVGHVATGMTDEDLAELTELFEPRIEVSEGKTVSVTPDIVFEVGYEEIQRSPNYDSGYALRFPRFVGVRDDLRPADADSLDRIERLASGNASD